VSVTASAGRIRAASTVQQARKETRVDGRLKN